jgi:subtilisin family serine protease
LDVVAPGREIWTTDVTGGYTCVSGTSFAAPHVSGIVALIWATDPDLSVWRVRNIIEQTTRKIGGNTYGVDPLRLNGLWNQFVGYGLVNAYAAVSAVSGSAPTADFASDTDEPVLHDIECRVLKNGLSTSSGVHLALIPQGYSY